jgi:hypothetical protein
VAGEESDTNMDTEEQKPNTDMGPQQIVIADRGWVWVGKTRRELGYLVIEDARNVRRWGTTAGLGQLAANGPTPDTRLDPVGTIKVADQAVIGVIKCNAAW